MLTLIKALGLPIALILQVTVPLPIQPLPQTRLLTLRIAQLIVRPKTAQTVPVLIPLTAPRHQTAQLATQLARTPQQAEGLTLFSRMQAEFCKVRVPELHSTTGISPGLKFR